MTFQLLNLRSEAAAEAERLAASRRYMRVPDSGRKVQFEATAPLVARTRRQATRRQIGRRLLLVFRMNCEDETGRACETVLIAVLCPSLGFTPADRPRERIRRALRTVEGVVKAHVEALSANWRATAIASVDAFRATRLERQRAVVEHVATAARPPYQSGLFDRRAERQRLDESDAAEQRDLHILGRLEQLERATAAVFSTDLVLVLTS